MLRSALLVAGLFLAGIGLACLAMPGVYSGWPFLIWGAVIVVAVLCERWRYRLVRHAEEGRWQKTGERFEDPETGESVEVLFDPATGERRYAPMKGRRPPPIK